MLAVIETHPVQYHAPLYRALQTKFQIPVTAIYGSDFSVAGYLDKDFGMSFAWDTDLLSGYESVFLSRVRQGGAHAFDEVASTGLKDVLRKIKPRAVLLCGYGNRFNRAAFFQARKSGCPILLRGETTDHALQRGLLKSFVRDRTLRQFYAKCDKLLYIGQHSYAHFKRLGCAEEKLIFSPYGVDSSSFNLDEAARDEVRASLRNELGILGNQVVILFSGKLIAKKGADLILKAVKQLSEPVREKITVMLLGSGSERENLEKLAADKPVVQTVFSGFQNQSQLSRYYLTADLLAFPSYSETWGLVVNEALHHGLPCIVSKAVGSAPDLIEPGITGEVFDTGSSADLAAKIQQSISLLHRADIRENCRRKVQSYCVEKAAEGIAVAYQAVVEPHFI